MKCSIRDALVEHEENSKSKELPGQNVSLLTNMKAYEEDQRHLFNNFKIGEDGLTSRNHLALQQVDMLISSH